MLSCWTTLRRYRHFRCSTVILAARQKVDTKQLSKSTGIHQTKHSINAAAATNAAATIHSHPVDESRPNWRLLTSTSGSIGLFPTVISTFVASS
ncbi:hypothetical protein CORC01_14187 [Colletotrichum orchidophilum]|uniref:Uncharacterized protein n=1 Tax=Colletotrichum orchidophilum TaxID=1209926 RepID=A0A1G4AMU6_9PEZI|nr:uncharacterized protein CORC01_14187 [Colletotrichum orchidophilum]OHE90518.1 hypothetical protein CORC01_14187 [Colletotrichum orchidophilum]